jgi:hypothetical protein
LIAAATQNLGDLAIAVVAILPSQLDDVGGQPLFIVSAPAGPCSALSERRMEENVDDIRLVVDIRILLLLSACLLMAWKAYCKFGELANFAIDLNSTAVLLRHDIITNGQAEPCSLAGRLVVKNG